MTKSEQIEKDIKETMEIYQFAAKLHTEYSYAYSFTNENIAAVWNFFNLKGNEKVLSVLASGDQIFELILKGIKNIDTFDCNRIAEYYTLGFKKTAIEVLKYDDFYELFNFKYSERNYDLEKYIISCAEEKYKKFWQELFYNLKQQGVEASVFDFVCGDAAADLQIDKRCNYLINDKNYKKLKKNLKASNILFNYHDITQLPLECGKYDLIYLSNILDYYDDIFRKYDLEKNVNAGLDLFQSIYDTNLKDPGEIILTFFHHTFIKEVLSNSVDRKVTCTEKVLYPGAAGFQKGRVLWKK